jgi:hypothetical protein
MKISKPDTLSVTFSHPKLRLEHQDLTSFSGQVLFQCLLSQAKKGQRSYYPLYCTVAQTGQVLDVLHRSGNVRDSNGGETFVSGAALH